MSSPKPPVPAKPIWLVGTDVTALHGSKPRPPRRTQSMYSTSTAGSSDVIDWGRSKGPPSDFKELLTPSRCKGPPSDFKELLTPRRHLFVQTGSLDAVECPSPPTTPLIDPTPPLLMSPKVCRSISTDSGLGSTPPLSRQKVRCLGNCM